MPMEPSIIVTSDMLLFILNELSRFILVFKYLISNEAWIGQAGQKVEDKCTQREHDDNEKDDYTVGLSCQEFPV